MTQGGGKSPVADKEKINLDPHAQAALEALVEKGRRKKLRQKLFRLGIVFFLALMLLSWSLGFYCRHVIGTHFETIITRKYPQFTGKVVRTAVISDKWSMTVLGPFHTLFSDKEELEFRRTVIELGLEATGEGEHDAEKIRTLRDVVAVTMEKYPERRQKGIAFAVYELPPRSVR